MYGIMSYQVSFSRVAFIGVERPDQPSRGRLQGHVLFRGLIDVGPAWISLSTARWMQDPVEVFSFLVDRSVSRMDYFFYVGPSFFMVTDRWWLTEVRQVG
jgi:hypothetical protein